MKKILILFMALFLAGYQGVAFSDTVILKGYVRHVNTYAEISNVNVYIKNSGIGTITKASGSFSLKITSASSSSIVVFEHVSFFRLEIPLEQALQQRVFNLRPRIIELPAVSIEAAIERPDYMKELPKAVSVIDAQRFEIQGYVDAADLLLSEQSIQVDEELSGKKTVSIRGGNPDDVLVLYNGVKMNSIYDNVVDFTHINLDDVQKFEIIRGSHTSLFGSGAVSGIINIIPRTFKPYSIKFQQKLGTYAMGAWDLHINQSYFDKINLSYNYKQGGMHRTYADSPDGVDYFENKSVHHTFSVASDLSDDTRATGMEKHNFNVMFTDSKLNYENIRYNETMHNSNQVVSMRYFGNFLILNNLTFTGSVQNVDRQDNLEFENEVVKTRSFDSHSIQMGLNKGILIKDVELLFGYQFERNQLDFMDSHNAESNIRINESADLLQQRHGLTGIAKLHVPTESSFFTATDLDISYRWDSVKNEFDDVYKREQVPSYVPSEVDKHKTVEWKESMLNFSSNFSGKNELFDVNAYLNVGANFKFPTMFQQLSMPATSNEVIYDSYGNIISNQDDSEGLKPEKNNSTEIGVEVAGETLGHRSINGWKLSANYFRNQYYNKIKTYLLPGSPVAFYENVEHAEISGFELKATLFIVKNKVVLEAGTSLYSISDKAAFPFKSDKKTIFNIIFNHAGYSLQFQWFDESDQLGSIRNLYGGFTQIALSGYSNINVHLSKKFRLFNAQLFINCSGRNLLDDDTELEGLSIRDRRLYVTAGIQY